MSRRDDVAATTESHEDRDERWIEWTALAWQHVPLDLYDEHQKPGQIAVEEMLARIHELEAEQTRRLLYLPQLRRRWS